MRSYRAANNKWADTTHVAWSNMFLLGYDPFLDGQMEIVATLMQ